MPFPFRLLTAYTGTTRPMTSINAANTLARLILTSSPPFSTDVAPRAHGSHDRIQTLPEQVHGTYQTTICGTTRSYPDKRMPCWQNTVRRSYIVSKPRQAIVCSILIS